MKEAVIASAIIAAFVITAASGVTGVPASYDDNARYIILAQSLLAGKGLSLINFPGEPKDLKTAIGYPVILAALILFFGPNIAILNASSIIFMAIALLFFYLLMAKSGVPPLVRIVTLALAAFHPVTMEYAKVALSEPSFILFSLAAMLCIAAFEKSGSETFLFAGFLLAVAACTIRYVGITIIFSILVILAMRKDLKNFARVGVPCAALIAFWLLKNAVNYQMTYIGEILSRGSYLMMTDTNLVTPLGFAKRYLHETAAYAGDIFPDLILSSMRYIAPYTKLWAIKLAGSALFLVVMAFGYIKLWKTAARKMPLVFTAVYCALLPAFPGYDIRLLLPVGFFVIMFFVYGLFGASPEAAYKKAPVILLALLLFSSSVFCVVLDTRTIRLGFDDAYKNYLKSLGYAKNYAENGSVIICRKPFVGYLVSGRKTLRYPYTADDREMFKYITGSKADYVIVDGMEVAGIYFSIKYLKPTIEKHRDRFESVYALKGPETIVYRIKD